MPFPLHRWPTAIRLWLMCALAAAALQLRAQDASPVPLSPFEVAAQNQPVGDAPDATMSKIAIFNTPGAAGDINRALQLLPGVAFADEGDALYVKGGAARETTTFIDGVPMPFSERALIPLGTPALALSPYYVQRASLYAGDLPVQFFDALSGAVDIETAHASHAGGEMLDVGLGSVFALAQCPLGSTSGLDVGGSVMNETETYRLSPPPQTFTEPPQGAEAFASYESQVAPGVVADVAGFAQSRRLGLIDEDPSYTGPFDQDTRTGFLVGRLKAIDSDGAGWRVSAGGGRDDVEQDFGNLNYAAREQSVAADGEWNWAPARATLLGLGADVAEASGGIGGEVPAGLSLAPGAPVDPIAFSRSASQFALYGSANWQPTSRLQVVSGLRVDRFERPGSDRVEPRLSASFTPVRKTTLEAYVGEVARPATPVDQASSPSPLAPTKMSEASVALSAKARGNRFRIGAYAKSYSDLIQYNQSFMAEGGGVGDARGLDFGFQSRAGAPVVFGADYTLGHSYRADPNSLTLAPSPFDVRDTLALTAGTRIGRWNLSAAYRFATGRPYTPITGGVYDPATREWTPVYGAPEGARLPDVQRIDISVSKLRVAGKVVLVPYLSVANLFDRRNIYAYTYSSDYSVSIPLRSLYARTVYFGFSAAFSR